MTANLKRVVKSLLARPRAVSAHPEADVLAAYAENTLLKRERATVIAHLSDCADCREFLSLAFPVNEEESAALPKPRLAWRWSPVWSWAASMAAICIVVSAVWEFRGQYVVTSRKPESAPMAIQAKKPEPAPMAAPAKPVVAREARQFTPPPIAAPEAKKTPAQPPPPPPPVLAAPQQTPPQPAADAGSAGALVSAQARPPAGDTILPASQAVEVRSSAPASRLKSASRFGAMGIAGRPRPSVRWSIGGESRGVLQRSDDGGATWTIVSLAGEVSFRAVTSSGDDVWVGGSAGALFHSSDQGAHWQRISFGATGTIVAIKTGASGEAEVTTDDGRTWPVKATQH
jgi:hypothetical protein